MKIKRRVESQDRQKRRLPSPASGGGTQAPATPTGMQACGDADQVYYLEDVDAQVSQGVEVGDELGVDSDDHGGLWATHGPARLGRLPQAALAAFPGLGTGEHTITVVELAGAGVGVVIH